MDFNELLKRGFKTTETGAVLVFAAIALGLLRGDIPWNSEFGPQLVDALFWLAMAIVFSRLLLKIFALIFPPETPEKEKTE